MRPSTSPNTSRACTLSLDHGADGNVSFHTRAPADVPAALSAALRGSANSTIQTTSAWGGTAIESNGQESLPFSNVIPRRVKTARTTASISMGMPRSRQHDARDESASPRTSTSDTPLAAKLAAGDMYRSSSTTATN
jgi:hypothetical protein